MTIKISGSLEELFEIVKACEATRWGDNCEGCIFNDLNLGCPGIDEVAVMEVEPEDKNG